MHLDMLLRAHALPKRKKNRQKKKKEKKKKNKKKKRQKKFTPTPLSTFHGNNIASSFLGCDYLSFCSRTKQSKSLVAGG